MQPHGASSSDGHSLIPKLQVTAVEPTAGKIRHPELVAHTCGRISSITGRLKFCTEDCREFPSELSSALRANLFPYSRKGRLN